MSVVESNPKREILAKGMLGEKKNFSRGYTRYDHA